jgi:hypothetical protein
MVGTLNQFINIQNQVYSAKAFKLHFTMATLPWSGIRSMG